MSDLPDKSIIKPKVSVIIPIYGVENFIEECLESLFNQSYENIEYIFVNDCSPDRSIEILLNSLQAHPNFKEKSKLINQSSNKGLASARYRGIIESSGEYVYHIDSDDWIEPNAIESLVQAAIDEGADMCVGDFFINYYNKEITQIATTAPKTEYIKKILSRNRKYAWTLCNRLIKRDLQLKALPIEDINMGEDYVTVPRLIYYSEKIIHVNQSLYHYRQTNTSSYTKFISQKSINDLISATDVLNKFFNDKFYSKEYLVALEDGKRRVKYDLFLSGNYETRRMVNDIFPKIDYRKTKSFSEMIIFLLARYKMFKVMDYVVKMGLKVKKKLKS